MPSPAQPSFGRVTRVMSVIVWDGGRHDFACCPAAASKSRRSKPALPIPTTPAKLLCVRVRPLPSSFFAQAFLVALCLTRSAGWDSDDSTSCCLCNRHLLPFDPLPYFHLPHVHHPAALFLVRRLYSKGTRPRQKHIAMHDISIAMKDAWNAAPLNVPPHSFSLAIHAGSPERRHPSTPSRPPSSHPPYNLPQQIHQ